MIENTRKEVWTTFRNEIAPLIRKGESIKAISEKLKTHIDNRYACIVRKYDDTVRVSVNVKSNGIIYFMAETVEGKKDVAFREPSYGWRSN